MTVRNGIYCIRSDVDSTQSVIKKDLVVIIKEVYSCGFIKLPARRPIRSIIHGEKRVNNENNRNPMALDY